MHKIHPSRHRQNPCRTLHRRSLTVDCLTSKTARSESSTMRTRILAMCVFHSAVEQSKRCRGTFLPQGRFRESVAQSLRDSVTVRTFARIVKTQRQVRRPAVSAWTEHKPWFRNPKSDPQRLRESIPHRCSRLPRGRLGGRTVSRTFRSCHHQGLASR